MFVSLGLIALILSLNIYSPQAFGEDEPFEELYNYVVEYIAASESYDIPEDNSAMLQVTSEETQDFGSYDFIVVGAGAAGAVVANRLSENSNWKVLLLEAGGEPVDFLKIVGLATYAWSSEFNWGYASTPQENACLGVINQTCDLPRGKGLGGSTNINGVYYNRGHREDYDRWEAVFENPGWSYEDVLPYFKKSEHAVFEPRDEYYHGEQGPITVDTTTGMAGLDTIVEESFGELGYEYVDYNGATQIGVSKCQLAIKGNERDSTATGFLSPSIQAARLNLTVSTGSFVTKILINNGTKLAEGVEFIKNETKYVAYANKEVIVSGGTFNSPQLLMLSGIGPKQHLEDLDIPVLADLPVGQNLQDHPMFIGLVLRKNGIFYNLTFSETLERYVDHLEPWMSTQEMVTYTNFGQGNSSRALIEFAFKVTATASPPNVTIEHSNIFGFTDEYLEAQAATNFTSDCSTFSILFHPKALGSLTLRSNDPRDKPIIDLNLLGDEEDVETLYQSIMLLIKVNNTQYFNETGTSFVILDSPGCYDYEKYSKEWWYCDIKHYTITDFHPISTNRMGPKGKNSVVNHNLLVHGFNNLRVIDASIMPESPSAHTMAPTIMIGEKGADIIKAAYGVA